MRENQVRHAGPTEASCASCLVAPSLDVPALTWYIRTAPSDFVWKLEEGTVPRPPHAGLSASRLPPLRSKRSTSYVLCPLVPLGAHIYKPPVLNTNARGSSIDMSLMMLEDARCGVGVLCGCSFAAPNEGLMQTHGENMNRGMDDQRNVLHVRPAVQVHSHSHALHALARLALVLRTLLSSLVRRFWFRLCSSLALFLSWSPCFCHWSTKTILPHCRPSALPVGTRRVSWE